MYVCICNNITERDIHRAVTDGCTSMRGLKRHLGVATECGRCATCARSVLREAAAASANATTHSPAMAAA